MLACQTRSTCGISISSRSARAQRLCGSRSEASHVFDMPTERPARPCRAARRRRHHDACRLRPSGCKSAVERRLGKKRTDQLQYLVGPPQFFDLALKLLHPLRLAGRDAFADAGIDISTLGPFVQGLRHAPNLGRDGSVAPFQTWNDSTI